MINFSEIISLCSLIFLTAVQGSEFFSHLPSSISTIQPRTSLKPYGAHVTLETFVVRGETEDEFHLSAALALEADQRGCSSLFINNLYINDSLWYGPSYFTSHPDFIDRDGIQFLYIKSLTFLREKNYLGLLPGDNGVFQMKRSLIVRKIFPGRDQHILVGDVIINGYSYGPFLLTA
jgi:hypothetical protein